MLKYHGVSTIVVFDGARSTPLKARTNRARRESREQALVEARAADAEVQRLFDAGENRDAANDARKKAYARTVRITPAMVEVAVRAATEAGARVIVAPYEADAQYSAAWA